MLLELLRRHYISAYLLFCYTISAFAVVMEGDGYLEYGIGRFEYSSSDWNSNGGTPLGDDTFMFTLGSQMAYSAETLSGTFHKGSFLYNSLSSAVESTYETVSSNSGNTELVSEYFSTSKGYPAGIIYYRVGFTDSISAEVWVDITDASDGGEIVLGHLGFIFPSMSMDEMKTIANGFMRYQGTPITSGPDDGSGDSDEGDSDEENSDELKNTISVEDKLVCDFQDGPISICLPQGTTVDFLHSYAENGLWTVAQYYPYPDGSITVSPMIFLQTESLYKSVDAWAANQSHSWESSEFNASITSKAFTTNQGFPATYIIREYDSPLGSDNLEYHIVVDLTTDAWKQRYDANQYSTDNAWLKLQFTGIGQSTSQNNFEDAMAIAMSVDYDQSVVPEIPQFVEQGSFSFESFSATGWTESDWLGVFFEGSGQWIYHLDLGWLYAEDASSEKSWLWSENKGWLWTSDQVYPHLYSENSENWIYVISDSDSPTVVYDYNPQEWGKWQDLTINMYTQPSSSISISDDINEVQSIMDENLSEIDTLNSIAEIIKPNFR